MILWCPRLALTITPETHPVLQAICLKALNLVHLRSSSERLVGLKHYAKAMVGKNKASSYVGFRLNKFSVYNTGEKAMDPSMVHAEKPNVSLVKKLLFRRMLVGVNDGRFFVGAFHCMDKQGNIILQDAVEYRSTRRSSPSPMEHRSLGLILIPSSCRSSCHVDCSIEEQMSLLSLQGVGENSQPE
ncbi:hypothetical protein Scep_025065 [Stephania cephalantha]|uniref:Sm domain-containing protein n=1 Tax=Stephania cephalantha TaxID=152367 RepID=A0AAP0EXP7_9MAGN